MEIKVTLSAVVMLSLCLLCGCAERTETVSEREDQATLQVASQSVTKTVVGSAESPDPILTEVQKLEREGVLKDVVVMESFPLQIKVTGPASVIEKLEKLPRKQLSTPE